MVSLAVVRTVTVVICVAGIAGMIVTSVLDHNGAAVTFGLVSAVAVLCSMVAKAVSADTQRRLAAQPGGGGPGMEPPDSAAPSAVVGGRGSSAVGADRLAAVVEGQVQAMVAGGADEAALRQLVGEAVRLGRHLPPPPAGDGPH